MSWQCGIDGCGAVFDDVESTIVHQATEHDHRECKVCGTGVPDGYLALRHAFTDHSRAEYVRAYGASSEEVRKREDLVEEINDVADLGTVVEELKR